jgi:flagellar biosynthesis/type III secretory pathway chaperone
VTSPAIHPDLQAARDTVQRLSLALETEFEALKAKDAERVEALQAEKTQVLDQLAQLVQNRRADGTLDTDWADVIGQVVKCQDAHRRNEYLARCQLEAVQNTLSVLHSDTSSTGGVDLYDRLGQVSRKLGARGYGAF